MVLRRRYHERHVVFNIIYVYAFFSAIKIPIADCIVIGVACTYRGTYTKTIRRRHAVEVVSSRARSSGRKNPELTTCAYYAVGPSLITDDGYGKKKTLIKATRQTESEAIAAPSTSTRYLSKTEKIKNKNLNP